MNERLTALLSSPTRDSLLSEIDGVVGLEPQPGDIMRMRRIVPDYLLPSAHILLDIVLGTRKAHRLGKAHLGWWYTVQGAEQATHPAIAAHHALRFEGCRHVVEVCTGVGMDTLALARIVGRVTTFESDAVTAALAVGNLKAASVSNVDVQQVSLHTQTALPAFDGLWADPSRRNHGGRRASSTKEYSPLLETLTEIGQRYADAIVGIKCGPGDNIPMPLATTYASEFIGYDGECRERVLWKNTDMPSLCVSLPDVNKQWTPHDASVVAIVGDYIITPGEILVEPHPALVASGALGAFFHEHELRPIHHKIAYGIGARATINLAALRDWAGVFEVVRVDQGVAEKRIQQHLRDLHWNYRTEFKKRGWNGDPEDLRRKLSFDESDVFGVVIIARTEIRHLTLYCKRLVF